MSQNNRRYRVGSTTEIRIDYRDPRATGVDPDDEGTWPWFDPATVVFVVTPPSPTAPTTYTYGVDARVRRYTHTQEDGMEFIEYVLEYKILAEGTYQYRITATSTVEGVEITSVAAGGFTAQT